MMSTLQFFDHADAAPSGNKIHLCCCDCCLSNLEHCHHKPTRPLALNVAVPARNITHQACQGASGNTTYYVTEETPSMIIGGWACVGPWVWIETCVCTHLNPGFLQVCCFAHNASWCGGRGPTMYIVGGGLGDPLHRQLIAYHRTAPHRLTFITLKVGTLLWYKVLWYRSRRTMAHGPHVKVPTQGSNQAHGRRARRPLQRRLLLEFSLPGFRIVGSPQMTPGVESRRFLLRTGRGLGLHPGTSTCSGKPT